MLSLTSDFDAWCDTAADAIIGSPGKVEGSAMLIAGRALEHVFSDSHDPCLFRQRIIAKTAGYDFLPSYPDQAT